MNKLLSVTFILLVMHCLFVSAEPLPANVLYIYDEVNEQSQPYIAHFRTALSEEGLVFDEAVALEMKTKDLTSYDFIIIHGMVMAFNSKSPVRDWLKTKPDLTGKKVSLFVTANRWFLKDLFKDLQDLLKKDNAEVIDAVSMATKTTTDMDEAAAVKKQVSRLK